MGRVNIGIVAICVTAACLIVACSSDDPGVASVDTSAIDSVQPVPADTGGGLPPTTVVDDQSVGPPDQDDLNPAPLPRACIMATLDEVGAIVGAMPTSNGEASGKGVVVCTFTAADDSKMASIRIATVQSNPAPAAAFAELSGTAGAELVADLGDEAVWVDGALSVMMGAELVRFTVFPQPTLENSEAQRSATLALAEVALPRYAPPPVG